MISRKILQLHRKVFVMGGHGNKMISRAFRLSVGRIFSFTYAGIFSMSGRAMFAICFFSFLIVRDILHPRDLVNY